MVFYFLTIRFLSSRIFKVFKDHLISQINSMKRPWRITDTKISTGQSHKLTNYQNDNDRTSKKNNIITKQKHTKAHNNVTMA